MSEIELLTVGRVNLDLYAQQVGAEFADVVGWDAMVGGSPANIAVAAARLGVRAGVVSAVGEDLVGDWVLRALDREGVDTAFVVRKRGPHTSLALRAQRPPDHPLAFYRHDPADIHVTVGDVDGAPVAGTAVVLVSGDALARGSMAAACADLIRRARRSGTTVYVDLDLREISWPDLRRYAGAVAPAVQHADVVLGTEAEFAALLDLRGDPRPEAVVEMVRAQLGDGGRVALVKHGERGVTLIAEGRATALPALPVDEASTVGAGDSFAAGLISARLRGLDWVKAARFGTACASITVGRYGCSAGFPLRGEALDVLDHGALAGRGSS